MSIVIVLYIAVFVVEAAVVGFGFMPVANFAAGLASIFTFFFSLSRLAFTFEVGALFFSGLIDEKPRDEPVLEVALASFFSSNAL